MKRVLVFSDLHANRRALMDIIPVLDEVDVSIFCGDLLGYGKDIDYCVDFVLSRIDFVVSGDHERFAVTNENLEKQLPIVSESALCNRNELSKKQMEQLSSLPKEIWFEDFYVTHSLNDDYLRTEEDFKRLLLKMPEEAKYAFFGHTHEQVLYKFGNKLIINPGSITKGRKGFHRGYTIICGTDVEFINLKAIL